MSVKSLAEAMLSRLAPLALKGRGQRRPLTIIAYHRILEADDNFRYDDGVISCSPAAFEKQIRFFKDHFSIISFRQLKESLDNRSPLPSNSLIITFDDGYKDNFTHAFPILRKYNTSATIFLSVRHIDTGENYWWDEAAFYLKHAHKSSRDIAQFLYELKHVPNLERVRRIKELARTIENKTVRLERQSLSWDDIRAMSKAGIEFGSHTMTHPVLSHVEQESELEYEIGESKKAIEAKIQSDVIVFSYPVGRKTAFNDRVKEKVRKAGYRFAVSYMHGTNDLTNSLIDLFELRRMDVDKLTLNRVKAKLAFPGLFKK